MDSTCILVCYWIGWCLNTCPTEWIKMPRLLLIFSQSDYLIQIVDRNSHTYWQTVQIRSAGFFRSQLIWIYSVCKGRVYPVSVGQGLTLTYVACWVKKACRQSFKMFLVFPPRKLVLTFHANCPSYADYLAWNVKALYMYLAKIRKISSICNLLNFLWEWY